MKPGKHLRTGYTTGTCAAAAAKGALLYMQGKAVNAVTVDLPGDQKATLQLSGLGKDSDGAFCEVVKDAGDDPDVTNGAVIRVSLRYSEAPGITIKAGEGVGIVTRPGLAVPPGEPAINPVPQNMIRNSIKNNYHGERGIEVTVGVEGGESLARKTLNPRLGIVGGISILGTTGLVIPYSHEAYRESIVCAFDVARALHLETVVLSTGKRSEASARLTFTDLIEPAFILMADHFYFAAEEALKHDIKKIIIACYPGKLSKMSAGSGCTHYMSSKIDLKILEEAVRDTGASQSIVDRIQTANTIRHAVTLMSEDFQKKVCTLMARQVIAHIQSHLNHRLPVEVLVVSYNDRALTHVH